MITGSVFMMRIKNVVFGIHILCENLKCTCVRCGKDLPNVNTVFDKYKEVDSFFDPHRFLDEFDTEKYFELLKD